MTDPGAREVEDAKLEAVRCVVAQFRAKFEADNAETLPALRCQHAKSHGCVDAHVIVARGLPGHLRKGIFAREGERYPALIRFSSASARPKPDTRPGAQGMAIKVFVPVEDEDRTTAQDFILSNHPVFPIRDVLAYCPFSQAFAAKSGRPLKFLRLLLPPRSLFRGFLIYLHIVLKRPATNPLTIRYWSQTPYKLGDEATVKYSALPERPSMLARLLSHDHPLFPRSANFLALVIGNPERNHALEDAMARRLAPGAPAARFAFQVQLFKDEDTTPIEDPRKEWKERDSPFHTVATIEIPAQQFTAQRRRNAAEALSFTPKHSLPDHEPQGSINRARVDVYDELSKRRNEINGVARGEPQSLEEWLSHGAARVPP